MLAVIQIFVEFNDSLIYIIQSWNNHNYSCMHVCVLDVKDEMKLKKKKHFSGTSYFEIF